VTDPYGRLLGFLDRKSKDKALNYGVLACFEAIFTICVAGSVTPGKFSVGFGSTFETKMYYIKN
jgi:hypothetical protein